jgi:regulatory protein
MTVCDISPRRKCRVAVSITPAPPTNLSGAEYEGEKLLIDRVIATRCNLVKGAELELDDIKQLVYVSECYRAKQKAIWLLSGQDYSEKGLYEKLLKNFTPKASAFAVAQMLKRGYINDENFAARLCDKFKTNNLSKRQIYQKLIQKGISKEIADSVLKTDNTANSDFERVLKLIKTKYAKKLSTKEDRQKTFNALMRRGFLVEDIKKAMKCFEDDCFEEEIC